jgi:hypothetical protein
MRRDFLFYGFALLCFFLAVIAWLDLLGLPNLPRFHYFGRETYLAILIFLGFVSTLLGYLNRR